MTVAIVLCALLCSEALPFAAAFSSPARFVPMRSVHAARGGILCGGVLTVLASCEQRDPARRSWGARGARCARAAAATPWHGRQGARSAHAGAVER